MVTFKEKLLAGRTLLGTFIQIPAPEMPEIVGVAGYDCAIIDMEHGMFGPDATIALIRACSATNIASVCRVPSLNEQQIGHVLDFGASAVMVPNVKSQEDALRAVEAAKYHPKGGRGICPFTRAADFDGAYGGQNYYQRANDETAVILQIEATEGINSLDDILAVPNIDCIFIGPFDLSQSLGIPGQVTDQRVLDAMQEVVRKAEANNIAVANFSVTLEQAHYYIDVGVRFIAYGTDTLVAVRAYRDLKESILNRCQ